MAFIYKHLPVWAWGAVRVYRWIPDNGDLSDAAMEAYDGSDLRIYIQGPYYMDEELDEEWAEVYETHPEFFVAWPGEKPWHIGSLEDLEEYLRSLEEEDDETE